MRVKKVREVMELSNTVNEEERNNVTLLCLECDDIFVLLGDKLTF